VRAANESPSRTALVIAADLTDVSQVVKIVERTTPGTAGTTSWSTTPGERCPPAPVDLQLAVRRAGAGDRAFQHPLVGTTTLAHETFDVNHADGQRLIAYVAAPGTPDHDAMVLLDRAGTLNPVDTRLD
jgi:hypothetical protein